MFSVSTCHLDMHRVDGFEITTKKCNKARTDFLAYNVALDHLEQSAFAFSNSGRQ